MSQSFKLELPAPQLLEKAQKMAGVDIFDEAAVEPLTVLVKSFNEESQLHQVGAKRIADKLLRILSNRLRMIRDYDAHPEIAEQEIARPIFVAGSVRTGSTKIQRLFTASGDCNWLPLWKTLNSASHTGIPGEDVGARIKDAELYVEELYEGSPGAKATHEQGAHIAEEESYILMQDFRCGGYIGLANVPGYLRWLAGQDMVRAYRYLRDTLKYLQWQGLADPSKRWFLKSPFHCGMEPLLRQVFPDAKLIVTHRLPQESIPSMCSMLVSYIESHTHHPVIDAHAIVAGFAASLEAHIAFRKANPKFPVFDINYRDAQDRVDDVIRHVYEFLDMQLKPAPLERMLSWVAHNPIHRHGGHQYTLADFDLTGSAIKNQCPNYLNFYHQQLG
jgi:hypothetical protein